MNLDRVIVALDFSTKYKALKIVDRLEGIINFYKVGLELFLSEGRDILRELKKRDKRIFLDLKFHDIPTTVQKAVKSILNFGVDMLSLHTTGGFEMMKKAREVVEETKVKEEVKIKLLGITVLTSLGNKEVEEIYGVSVEVPSLVRNLALISKKAGLDGVVASAGETTQIKKSCGKDFTVVTPGIRLERDSKNDQKRVFTPKEAFSLGADYIVIGRALTVHREPEKVIEKLIS